MASEIKQRKTSSSSSSESSAPTVEPSTAAPPQLLAAAPNKWKTWWVRFFSSLVMIFSFFFIIYLGHLALVAMIILLQIIVFNEIMKIAQERWKNSKKSADEEVVVTSQFLSWFYFCSTSYFVLGKIFLRFENSFLTNPITAFLAKNHIIICYALYTIGFVGFVFSLKKGFYKKQFIQFTWTIVTLLVVVIQASFQISNIFEGLFWFFLPAALIVCNDIWAFIFGFFFGKTPLISLSPKKTWEGFLGGLVATWFWGFVMAYVCSQLTLMTCPRTDFFHQATTCEANPVFVFTEYKLPSLLVSFFHLIGVSKESVWLYPAQLHTLNLATFASLIAPFGGFFASGFKRAFKIKDFSDSIPGHGGITDRMDCQFIMGMFSFVYITQFIRTQPTDIELIVKAFASLDEKTQLLIYSRLGKLLESENALLY
eukprot:TRINITY_DN1850_c0_g4_i1.p1 TRINITY_DN1850_c0_g4~~TRINITY_DN1850_c0_g4_i1.p1  ORF type:complete len:426 (-),score=125.31 TRINITY_DN1850_c0_g4_i1:71-1348(-)